MNGQDMYFLWCNSVETDQARYWDLMNPAEKLQWARLAEIWSKTVGAYEGYDRAGWILLALPPEIAELIVGQKATRENALALSEMIRAKYGVVEQPL
jgi:hypothetical protein